MKPRERERRRRAKHKWQKAKRRENKIADVERRLLGAPDPAMTGAGILGDFYIRNAHRISSLTRRHRRVPGI